MAKIFNIGRTRRIGGFIVSVYGVGMLKILRWFIFSSILLAGLIAGVYELLKPKSSDLIIISILAEDGNICFPKGWELTPVLESAIESGEISLNNITVTTCGPETSLSGGDSDKLAILDYRTEIEDNTHPQIYFFDEYFEELKKQGKNTYVVKTLGLVTESEGAK